METEAPPRVRSFLASLAISSTLTFRFTRNPPQQQQQQQQPSSKMKTCPELTYEVDPKVMVFALKFLNSAPKEKLILELELTETIANKVIDQRDFGGYKNLDDVFDKKLMRKKKFTTFRDRLLAYAKDNKPSPKVDGEEEETNGKAKKGKKGKGGAATKAQTEAMLAQQKAERPVFKETEPLLLRFGYLMAPPPKPVLEEVEIEIETAQPISVA
ncbi:Aste57867_17827 [Aphanomyces stellatus]|uniref:Aste57867_17827 protein n=1 Tax=Aphanomyces stellatus TaxID=120398 RepID=A0A485L8W6_9STRA|nr:hypothetical protein As57867_017766 [Aphanomyces stellatus]VFT94570.1 Aste57867_17827 [Aphanomyces stellatus]